MSEAKVLRRWHAAEAKFFGKISREFFAGASPFVAGVGASGGGKLGYFTANPDFGKFGEIAGESSAV